MQLGHNSENKATPPQNTKSSLHGLARQLINITKKKDSGKAHESSGCTYLTLKLTSWRSEDDNILRTNQQISGCDRKRSGHATSAWCQFHASFSLSMSEIFFYVCLPFNERLDELAKINQFTASWSPPQEQLQTTGSLTVYHWQKVVCS